MSRRNASGTLALVAVLVAAGFILGRVTAPASAAAAASETASEAAPAPASEIGAVRGHWMYVGTTPAGGQLWLDCWHYGGIYIGPDGTPVPDRALLPTPAEMATCDTLQHDVAFGGPSI